MAEFQGFPEDLFRFFVDLAAHNERPWFQAQRSRYDDSVVAPMRAFIVAMAPRLAAISAHYRADPRANGGSMFRIHRDVRFAKDKSPYKTHAACQFRHAAGRDAHAPGFYVHLAPGGLLFGGGIWRPPPAQLALVRDRIADSPRAWQALRDDPEIRRRGGIAGEGLARAPRGYDAGHPHVEDLKRKSLFVMESAEPAAACRPDFPDRVDAAFRAAAPLARFVTEALDLPF